ncbi:CpaE family protein [Paractinoplanes ferrugineus]|uniref:Pilus assembly protein CpaE n=1 Tax=Paractinoplanes ferrugineus TaxID=113564 RepID=A0A919MHG3_9ACTN|nr:AAA family ATPase [Actinoplanes ferrugineus]GIE15798.1 pilus assembly protein CpaE [Actinoplanes ferrugineus]
MSLYVYLEPDRDRLAQVGPQFQSIGCTIVHNMADLEAHLPRYPETLLVIVGATVPLDEVLMFTAYQRLQRPLIGVVLIRRHLDPEDVLRCLRSGVREVVEEADWDGIRNACSRSVDLSKALGTTLRTNAEAAPYGRVVTVFAGKGGCGRSVIAVNLATALAAAGGRRVLLVDLDLQFGDVAIMLKLPPERNIAGAIAMAGRLDEPGLRSIITTYKNGIDVLLAPSSPAQGEHVRRELIVEILDLARPNYDFIVVDTPALVTDQVLAALDMSDLLVPIVTPDLPTLKSVRLTVEMFDMLDYAKERRLLVFNRSNSEVGLTADDISEAIGMPFAVHVPSSREVTISVNRAEPLYLTNPTHPFSQAIGRLADLCTGTEPGGAQKRRLFSRSSKGRR